MAAVKRHTGRLVGSQEGCQESGRQGQDQDLQSMAERTRSLLNRGRSREFREAGRWMRQETGWGQPLRSGKLVHFECYLRAVRSHSRM